MESEENMEAENMENEDEMEKEKSMPEAEMTAEGKWKCRKDSTEYDNKEDYEEHYREEHME